MLGVTAFALSAGVAVSSVADLTVYRITPRNYTGITNLDTGDSAGDAFFGLYEMSAPVVCNGSSSEGASGLLCRNDPLLQIPGFNVYIRVDIEVDDRFGEYNECNPSSTLPHEFVCGHEQGRSCWYNDPRNPQWATQFADFCDKSKCECDVIETHAVGREFPRFGATSPPGTPKTCSGNYYTLESYGNYNKNTVYNKTANVTLADCCDMCTGVNSVDDIVCGSYTFLPTLADPVNNAATERVNEGAIPTGPGTCVIHGKTSFNDLGPMPSAVTGYFTGLGVKAFVQFASGQVSEIMNGTWYSTQAPGQCNSTGVLGKDCWWRLKEQTAQVNATCVNDAMVSKVMAQRPECLAGCPEPTNRESVCYIDCLFKILVGNESATPPVPATPRQLILDAFEGAFDTCTPVPDCPDPCLPPCWAVSAGTPCDPDFEGVL